MSIPASTAEKHPVLSRCRAGSLPHSTTRGVRDRRGCRAAAQLRADQRVGWVLVPCAGARWEEHGSGAAVDVRGRAVPPNCARAHSTRWPERNGHLLVY